MSEEVTRRNIKTIKIFWIILLVPVLFIFILFTLISTGNLGFMPSFEELENPNSNLSSEIFTADQQLLGKYYRQNRTVVQFDNLPQNLVNALVATEDIRFSEHSGIDPRGLGRVLFKTILMGKKRSGGGSTITQQLAKNLFPRDTVENRSKISYVANMAITKFKEWVIAVKLERNYTKEEILAMYFNTVPFGSQAYGIKAASRTFFNLPPDSLNLEQSALLVGIVNAPTLYSPVRNPKNSLNRRNKVVLYQMYKYGYITKEVYDSVKTIPLNLNYSVQSHKQGYGTYFREYLRTALTRHKPERENYASYAYSKFQEDSIEWMENPLYGWCNKNNKPNGKPYDIYSDGLKIYTTINYDMQRYAEEAVKEHMGGYLQPLFFKMKKGKSRAPFDWRVTKQEVNKIMYLAMIRSERYRVLKKEAKLDSAQIAKNFRTPTRMTVFSWNGDIDTVMSPMDSILYYKHFLHAGVMSFEPQTGYVRAYVGDIEYEHFKFDNVMLARRQVGSTFKPIIYTMAMMPDGFSPCHQVPNIPVTFEMPEGQDDYTPKFSTGGGLTKYEGKMVSLKFGLAQSMNQISAWVLKQYNPHTAVQLAKKMGIKSEIPEVPSICVGAAEVKLSEMVGAYGTFINKGVYVEPIFVTRIEDKNGNIISTFKPKKNEVISEGTAFRMITLMQGVVDGGTSVRLRYQYGFKNEIAGKTGTTNDNSDGWFMGIVPNLVTGVWVGGEERSIRFASGTYGQGASMALPIWALYMQNVYANEKLGISKANFERPEFDDGVETDCDKYYKEHGVSQDVVRDVDIY
ncbi:MAG: transglycosylase domain-containing protein [Bacteroidales bacterium]|nr:transglycosylase domain-containing protein [Bacteroidales bacterium]MBN2755919.1 transglycosylase domain-containing protein [Bacteroidales bacterium]